MQVAILLGSKSICSVPGWRVVQVNSRSLWDISPLFECRSQLEVGGTYNLRRMNNGLKSRREHGRFPAYFTWVYVDSARNWSTVQRPAPRVNCLQIHSEAEETTVTYGNSGTRTGETGARKLVRSSFKGNGKQRTESRRESQSFSHTRHETFTKTKCDKIFGRPLASSGADVNVLEILFDSIVRKLYTRLLSFRTLTIVLVFLRINRFWNFIWFRPHVKEQAPPLRPPEDRNICSF